jgi:L-seryl-tRNA(Ser) seleniumtransferase
MSDVAQAVNPLRGLPSVDRLLRHPAAEPLLSRFSREYVTRHCRSLLDDIRTSLRSGQPSESNDVDAAGILSRLAHRLESHHRPRLTRVINATGTLVHTNLGRAVLPRAAVEAVAAAAGQHVNLEYDLEIGARGRREDLVEELLRDLTGAEAATVVNNNAAAVLLALNTIAERREAVVSRGELVEIGGSFRIPDIMGKSGALLREVGTTNRTNAADYEQAIGPDTALLLKVHTSNYRIVGFSAAVDLATLVAIGSRHGVPVMEDLGSGALVDLSGYGLPREPVVADSVAAGADVVTFSGDKVLGGPQAGLIVGRKTWVDAIRRNPLHRALRCGKLTLAALEATLRVYRESPDAAAEIPSLRAFTRPLDEVEAGARRLLPALEATLGPEFTVTLEDSASEFGSGALPTETVATKVLALRHASRGPDWIAAKFRSSSPPIIGRVENGAFLLDVRGVEAPEDLIPRW